MLIEWLQELWDWLNQVGWSYELSIKKNKEEKFMRSSKILSNRFQDKTYMIKS